MNKGYCIKNSEKWILKNLELKIKKIIGNFQKKLLILIFVINKIPIY